MRVPSKSLVYLRLENFLVLALGVCIFVSKPGIYGATGLLVLYGLVRVASDHQYRQTVLSSGFSIACGSIYLLGVVAALIAPGTTQDLSWIARKSLFLLSFVPLYFAFRQEQNRRLGLLGLLTGFWVAAVLTVLAGNWREGNPPRLDGATWFVDVWGVLCALLAAFLLPRVFSSRIPVIARALFAATVICALTMLLLTNARGPWLGAFAGITIYLLLCQRKALVILLLLTIIAYLPARYALPDTFGKLETRILSMVDTRGEQANAASESNWIRLQLWKVSLAQNLDKLKYSPLKLLFGSGPENHLNEFKAFFDRTQVLSEADKDRLRQFNFPSNDVHNMYLDATAKMGLLWTSAMLALLLTLGISGLSDRTNSARVAATATVITFLVIGGFYDLLGHFASFFLFFFIALALRSGSSDVQCRR